MGQTGRRSNKLQRLVDDFAETCRSRGIEVSRPVIEHGLRDRIDMVAQHMGITETTALRNYFDDSWGQEMAEQFCADVEAGEARLAAVPDAVLPAGFVGRLVAALGQAQFFAAVNTASLAAADSPGVPSNDAPADAARPVASLLSSSTGHHPSVRFDPHMAAEATTGLGIALHDAATGPGLEIAEVEVSGRVLAQTREVLEDLARRLEPGPDQWRACGCEGPCEEQDTPTLVGDAVRTDLELLYRTLDQDPLTRYGTDAASDGDAQVLQFGRAAKSEHGAGRRGR